MLDALWGGFVGNPPLRPGNDGPPQDPMNERKNRKKERVGGGERGGEGYVGIYRDAGRGVVEVWSCS